MLILVLDHVPHAEILMISPLFNVFRAKSRLPLKLVPAVPGLINLVSGPIPKRGIVVGLSGYSNGGPVS
jgi:hypothetical protein